MEKKKRRSHEEFIQFLREKKEKDGRLSKLGEWLLSHNRETREAYDMKAVLR